MHTHLLLNLLSHHHGHYFFRIIYEWRYFTLIKRRQRESIAKSKEQRKKGQRWLANGFLKKPTRACKNKNIFSRKPITRLSDDESIWNWIISSSLSLLFSPHSRLTDDDECHFGPVQRSGGESNWIISLRSGHKERLNEFLNSMHDAWLSLNMFCNYYVFSAAQFGEVRATTINREGNEMNFFRAYIFHLCNFPFTFFFVMLFCALFSSTSLGDTSWQSTTWMMERRRIFLHIDDERIFMCTIAHTSLTASNSMMEYEKPWQHAIFCTFYNISTCSKCVSEKLFAFLYTQYWYSH